MAENGLFVFCTCTGAWETDRRFRSFLSTASIIAAAPCHAISLLSILIVDASSCTVLIGRGFSDRYRSWVPGAAVTSVVGTSLCTESVL